MIQARDWPTTKLADTCDFLAGYAFKSSQFTDSPADIPLVKGQNLGHREIDWIDAARWPANELSGLEKYQLVSGDIVLAMDRPIVQDKLKFAWMHNHDPDAYLVQRVARLRGSNGLSTKFLRYLIASPEFFGHIQAITTGVNVPHISGRDILSFRFKFPPIDTQRKVADILSAYDDLIANNNRRMALLEESIHLLYREWFVRLRFPGHERLKVVDGVPEGWERTTVENAFQILGGGTPSRKEERFWADGTINWYAPSDLTKAKLMFMESSSDKINEAGLSNSSARLFPPYSVMMTSRATIGAVAINTTEACTNQGFITCIPNEQMPLYFLYCWILANVDVFINLATGATFKEISKGVFKKIPILVPAIKTTQEFEEIVRPMAETVLNLQRQNRNLREARDMLLPRLMNGDFIV